jgi:GntR family transcriptional regulator
VADDLLQRMGTGEFDRGFPTELSLEHAYQVSRQTVREALRRLTQDGLLLRERGRGTSLTTPQLEQPLHALYSLAQSVVDRGWTEHSVLRAQRVEPAGPHAGPLALSEHDPVLLIERLRFADDQPLALDRSWLPADLAPGLANANFSTGSVYDRLAVLCGVRVTGGWEVIRPRTPTAEERRLLQLPRSEAVFRVERLARAGTRPVEYRISHIRGDRYAFRAEWPG